MNKAHRTLYSLKNNRRMKRWEKLFVNSIYKVLQKQMTDAAALLKSKGVEALKSELDQMITIEGLSPVIQRLYVFVGVKSADQVTKEINQDVKIQKKVTGAVEEKWVNLILQYFRLYLLSKAVVPVTQETRRRILEIVDKGLKEGWGIDRMADELSTDSFTMFRARMITRTEILKAQHYGHNVGAQESEWETTKQWISAHDHRTRHSHRSIDGETIMSNGKFAVDRYRGKLKVGVDMMDGPGDPTASPENVIQCRCTRAMRAARDEKGRLIRKSKISVVLPGDFTRVRQTITI